MNNPKCPYCGGEMTINGAGNTYWYFCSCCWANSPSTKSPEAAYAAAMKRERAIKPLSYRAGHYFDDDCDYPDLCVYVNGVCPDCGQVLCRVSEATIRYPDERMYCDNDMTAEEWKHIIIETEDAMLKEAPQKKNRWPNFCPNCGADMRKEGENEAY